MAGNERAWVVRMDQMHWPVGGEDGLSRDLVALLDEKRGEIALAWVEAIRRAMADTPYGQRPAEEIRDNNLMSLDLVKELLLGAESLPPEWEELPQLSEYVRLGVRTGEIVVAARLLGEVLSPAVEAAFPADTARGREIGLRLEAVLSRFVALLAELVAARTTRYLEEQQARTELMLGMARAASANLELDKVLQATVEGIAAAAGAGHGIMILVDEDGSSGTVRATTGEFPAPAAEALARAMKRPFALKGTVLVQRVVEKGGPMACADVQSDPILRANATLQGARALLGVPCMVEERVLGVALVADYCAARSFREEEVELALGLANVVAPAIENARLYEKVEQMAIVEERARLAQEIHDNLAQTLGAMQFYATLSGDLLDQEQIPQARASLKALEEMIEQAYVDTREAIYDLRSLTSLQLAGLAALQSYLGHYEQRYGLEVRLKADGEAVGLLAGAPAVQVFRILQEALSNVRKHTKTGRAWVELEREGPWVRIEVRDEGPGFDPAEVADLEAAHFGLQIMRERAEKVGGTLSVEAKPGQGTRVVVQVPYAQRGGPA